MNDKEFVMNQPLDTASCGSAPRVLVADDDPSSRRFLGDGLRSLGAETETCVDGETALQLVRNVHFDLLLLDCRMPAGGALHILGNLRADSQARSADAAAVATVRNSKQAIGNACSLPGSARSCSSPVP